MQTATQEVFPAHVIPPTNAPATAVIYPLRSCERCRFFVRESLDLLNVDLSANGTCMQPITKRNSPFWTYHHSRAYVRETDGLDCETFERQP